MPLFGLGGGSANIDSPALDAALANRSPAQLRAAGVVPTADGVPAAFPLGLAAAPATRNLKTAGPPISNLSATLSVLDYLIVPRVLFTKSSTIEIESYWQNQETTSGNNATINIRMSEAGFQPVGNGNGNPLVLNAALGIGTAIVRTSVRFLNDLHAQVAGHTATTGAGPAGTGNISFSTWDFENFDMEIVFAGNASGATAGKALTFLGATVKVVN
jgi:hypothetical protein